MDDLASRDKLLWLWDCITHDLIQQGVDTSVLHSIINTNYGINRYSSDKEYYNGRQETNGDDRGG